MNKILIVGHPQSGYEEVERLLHACGMAGAQPSRRDGFLPAEISATLCKAHGTALPAEAAIADDEICQIEAGAVWHGMALDLMLGNLDQPFWGWADPQAVHLLNYWRDLDPAITFILLYDQPRSVLTRLGTGEAVRVTPETLASRVRGWTAYNAALLHFFHRNPQRCLLVHTEQVRTSAGSYLQQLRARIDAPWSERMDQLAAPDARAGEAGVSGSALEAAGPERAPVPESQAQGTGGATDPAALAVFLADAVVRQHPAALQLYEELQASASLPLADDSAAEALAPLQAWLGLSAQQLRLTELDQQLHQQQQLTERLSQASEQRMEQLCQATEQVRRAQQRLAELEQALQGAREGAEQENELLLTQLNQVQEELERHYLDKQQLQQQAAERQRALDEQTRQFQAQSQAAQQRLAELRRARQDAEQEGELLLTQLHQVQEELERYYLENQRLKNPPKPAAPPAKPKPVYTGAAQRVKEQLTYRLGAVLVARSGSLGGWLGMPFALLAEARRFRREQPARAARKLPPIHTYQDAQEADKVRQHLSFRLGQALLQNARSPLGWLRLPFALRREVREFRRRQQKA